MSEGSKFLKIPDFLRNQHNLNDELRKENEDLRHDIARHIKIIAELEGDRNTLEYTVKVIAGELPPPDYLMGHVDLAKAALKEIEK